MNGMHNFKDGDISTKDIAAHRPSLWCPTHYFITRSQQVDRHRVHVVFFFVTRLNDRSTLGKDLDRCLGWIGDTCCGNEAMWAVVHEEAGRSLRIDLEMEIVSAEIGKLQTVIRERWEDRDTGYFHIFPIIPPT